MQPNEKSKISNFTVNSDMRRDYLMHASYDALLPQLRRKGFPCIDLLTHNNLLQIYVR